MWLKITGAALLLVVAAFLLAAVFAPSPDIATSVQIAAPPARVWAVLTDLPAYPAWNPEMILRGDLVPGATIENIEGTAPDQTVFRPIVTAVSPERELRWLGHLPLFGNFWLPRVFDADHYLLLQPTADGGTLFTQGEHFHGILLWLFDPNQLLPDFQAMNAALKARAEAAG